MPPPPDCTNAPPEQGVPRAKSRRVLMIACTFPPSGGPGVQRSVKFAKFLPRFGWRPCIWSAQAVRAFPVDHSLEVDVPDCAERRTVRTGEWARAVEAWGHAAADWLGPDSGPGRVAGAAAWRVGRWLRGLTGLLVPDERVGWVLRSYGPLCRWVRRERIDAIYSTHSPPSNHLLALLVKRATGLPWVADFRDPWTDAFNYVCPRRWQHWLNVKLEDRILSEADAVVAATPRFTEMLRGHVNGQGALKFRTIHNGADLDDFDFLRRTTGHAERRRSDGRFRITFVGCCDRHRFTPEVRKGLNRFRERARTEGIPFRFRVVGPVSSDLTAWLDSFGGDAECLGYVEHKDAVREMAAADLLLVTIRQSKRGTEAVPGITAKLYEYFAAGRPILLASATNSEATPLVLQSGAGQAVPLDEDAVSEALLGSARAWKRGDLPQGFDAGKLGPYTREETTRQLALVLDALATGAPLPAFTS